MMQSCGYVAGSCCASSRSLWTALSTFRRVEGATGQSVLQCNVRHRTQSDVALDHIPDWTKGRSTCATPIPEPLSNLGTVGKRWAMHGYLCMQPRADPLNYLQTYVHHSNRRMYITAICSTVIVVAILPDGLVGHSAERGGIGPLCRRSHNPCLR